MRGLSGSGYMPYCTYCRSLVTWVQAPEPIERWTERTSTTKLSFYLHTCKKITPTNISPNSPILIKLFEYTKEGSLDWWQRCCVLVVGKKYRFCLWSLVMREPLPTEPFWQYDWLSLGKMAADVWEFCHYKSVISRSLNSHFWSWLVLQRTICFV